MNKKLEEYKFDHFKNIDEVMHYFNYWYKEEDVYSINRYLSLKDFNYISNKYQELQQENEMLKDNAIHNDKVVDKVNWENMLLKKENRKYKEVIDKVSSLIKLYGKYNGEKCTRGFSVMTADFNKLLDILKEVK